MTETRGRARRKKLQAVAKEVMKPENAPSGYTVKVIVARGSLYSTISKKEE